MITKIRRCAARRILARSREFDADTMRITRAGIVTALKDADKTGSDSRSDRFEVGHIDDLVTAAGVIREGY